MSRAVAGARFPVGLNLGSCIDMASSTSRVTFTVPAALDPANLTSFTWAEWLFPRSIDGTSRRVIEPNGGTGAGFQCFLSAQAGLVVRVMHSVNNAEQDSMQGTLQRGVWTPVVMTWDDADGAGLPKLYLAGTQYAPTAGGAQSAKIGTRANWSGSTAYLGNTSGLAAAYNGKRDLFCVWNRVLSADEIAAYSTRAAVPSSGLVLCYGYEDSVGAGTVADSAGTATGTATSCTQGGASFSIPARASAF